MTEANYPRDLKGYGRNAPDPKWPNRARVAVQFVVNFEEGGENNILHGDKGSEAFLSDVLGANSWTGRRHPNVESMFEYGSRAGFWRLWRGFVARDVKPTVFGVATALMRNPECVAAMNEAGWDIASHGLKWIEHKDMDEREERRSIEEAIALHTQATGQPPSGWYTGRTSENTLKLVIDQGGFLYSCELLRRRPAVLGEVPRAAAPDHSLHARRQRHALHQHAGVWRRGRVLPVPEGQL